MKKRKMWTGRVTESSELQSPLLMKCLPIPGEKLNIVLMCVVPLMVAILRSSEPIGYFVRFGVRKCIDLCNTLYSWRYIRGCIQKFPDWVDNETTATNTCWEASQRVMAIKLTRLTHNIAVQLHLVAESCTICSSLSR